MVDIGGKAQNMVDIGGRFKPFVFISLRPWKPVY